MSDYTSGNAGDVGDYPSGITFIDPTTGRSDDGNNGGRSDGDFSRRGRTGNSEQPRSDRRGPAKPAGTYRKKADNQSALDGIELKDILLSIHMMLALRFNCDKLQLSPEEAEVMQMRLKNVARHYPMHVTQKQLDIGMLLYSLVDVYGTRAVAAYVDRNNKHENVPSDNVSPFRPAI